MAEQQPGEAIEALLSGLAIPADIAQFEAMRTILQLRHDWQLGERPGVIAAILARSPRQQERLRAELTRLLEPPEANQPDKLARAGAEATAAKVEPTDDTPELLKLRDIATAVKDTVHAQGKRLRRVFYVFVGVAVVLILVVGGKSLPIQVPVLDQRWSGTRDILIFILVGFAGTIPLGALIEVAIKTFPKLRKKAPPPRLKIVHSDKQATWFPIGSIAREASLKPFDPRQTLAMGRAVPFRLGSADSSYLDAGRSVAAMAAVAAPELRFVPRREPWPVLVLEDLDSGARSWSEMPRAICDALKPGLDVSHGVFYGVPDRFELDDGTRLDLSGLLRHDALLLFVSDGAPLNELRNPGRALERLGETRRAAWLDEREVRFWHPSEAQFGVSGLPAWPATAEGVALALRQLGGERLVSPRAGLRPAALAADAVPSAQLACGLGDALLWAAACAMVQPTGPGLAEALRQEFFSGLPPLAFGRMARLPGSEVTLSGLRFGSPLLEPLRQTFATRNPPWRRDKILQFLRDKIEFREPPQSGPAHDSYSWYRARLLLDQCFADAVPELLRLEKTALRAAIKQDWGRIRLPDAPGDSDTVRLLRQPDDIRALVKLSKAYEVMPAGADLEAWRIVPGPDRVGLPAGGIAAAVAASASYEKAAAVLLDNGTVYLGNGIIGGPPEDLAPDGPPSGNFPLLFALSHVSTYAAVANFGAGGLRIRDLRGDGLELLQESGASGPFDRMAGPVLALAWSPTAPILLVASAREGTALVDLRGATPAVSWSDTGGLITAVGFSADGAAFALADNEGTIEIRSYPLAAKRTAGPRLEPGLAQIDALVLGKGFVAAAGDARLVVMRRGGGEVGSWRLPPGRVEALELTDNETAVAVLIDGRLQVIHAASGVDLLIEDKALPGRVHAAIAIDRHIALLWSADRRSIDVHRMDREIDPAGAS